MGKETFLLNAFHLLLFKPSVSLEEMKPTHYGISRATAWRVLDALRKVELVFLSGEWSITQKGREWFCGQCIHLRRCVAADQERHKQISKRLKYKAAHPQ